MTAVSALSVFAGAVWMGWRSRAGGRAHRLMWSMGLLSFALGTFVELLGRVSGWPLSAYALAAAVVGAASIGQGNLYVARGGALSRVLLAVLLASGGLVGYTLLTPATGASADQGGRWSLSAAPLAPITPVIIMGMLAFVTLVGSAARCVLDFLYNHRGGPRALGLSLVALLAIGLVFVARAPQPESGLLRAALRVGLLAALLGAFSLGERPPRPSPLSASELVRRRMRIRGFGIGLALALIFGSIIVVRALYLVRGTGPVQHSYVPVLSEEVRGAYLITDQGVMQLYDWGVQSACLPDDAPELPAASVHEIRIVQKQPSEPERYVLVELTSGRHVEWEDAHRDSSGLTLISGPLAPGDYMLVADTDSLFGERAYHYFRLR